MADEAAPQARSSEVVAPGELRASHDDRDRIVELLRVAGGDGRLSAEELDERVGAALTARTYGELSALVSDLPPASGGPVAGSAAQPKEVVRLDCQHSNIRREGRWMVPQRMELRVQSGNVVLDFTQAEVTWPTLQVDVNVHGGRVVLVTKPGIVVDTDDVAMHSGNVQVRAPKGPDVPVTLRIEMSGEVRHGHLVTRPRPIATRRPRRSFGDWLRRRPRPALPAGDPRP